MRILYTGTLNVNAGGPAFSTYHTMKGLNAIGVKTELLGFEFGNNGKLDSSFIADLSNQLNNLGKTDNLKKAKQELADFVSYLKKLKTSENQIITLQKSMDRLAEIKGKLTDGKKIELMSDNQASAVQQVEVQMQKMQEAMTQLQGGATKTSTEIRTLTTESQNAGNKLKMAFDEGTASVNKLGTTIRTVASYIIGGGILIQGIQAIKNAFSELSQIDKDLIDISRVANESLDLSAFTGHANELGMTLNQTTDNILRTAYEVQKTHVDAELDPMTADERRVVHNALSRIRNISTESTTPSPSSDTFTVAPTFGSLDNFSS